MAELAKADIPVERYELCRDETICLLPVDWQGLKGRIINPSHGGRSLSACTVRVTSPTSVAARTCRPPAKSRCSLMKLAGAFSAATVRNEMRLAWLARLSLKKRRAGSLPAHAGRSRKARPPGDQQLDLFQAQDETPGSVFWQSLRRLFQSLINFMRQRQEQAGYVEVNTPDVMDRGLWKPPATGSTTAKTCSPRKPKTNACSPSPMGSPGAVSMYAHGLQ